MCTLSRRRRFNSHSGFFFLSDNSSKVVVVYVMQMWMRHYLKKKKKKLMNVRSLNSVLDEVDKVYAKGTTVSFTLADLCETAFRKYPTFLSLSINPLHQLRLLLATVLMETESSFSSDFHVHATEDRARAESPSAEVCAYTDLLCGFFELVRHVKRRLEKVYCFQPLGFLSP